MIGTTPPPAPPPIATPATASAAVARFAIRLLPRRSGSMSVRSSATRTKPAASPRGLTSSPSGPLVASATKGDAAIRAA